MINKTIYLLIGLSISGRKEILGMWISESESAWFWMSVFRNTTGQLCIVHQIRNSCKFVVWKDKKEFSRDLKCIYIANNLEQAVDALDTLEDKWGNKYYYAIKSWRDK